MAGQRTLNYKIISEFQIPTSLILLAPYPFKSFTKNSTISTYLQTTWLVFHFNYSVCKNACQFPIMKGGKNSAKRSLWFLLHTAFQPMTTPKTFSFLERVFFFSYLFSFCLTITARTSLFPQPPSLCVSPPRFIRTPVGFKVHPNLGKPHFSSELNCIYKDLISK